MEYWVSTSSNSGRNPPFVSRREVLRLTERYSVSCQCRELPSVDFTIVLQFAETNASPRMSEKPTRHQRRVVTPPGLATGLLFPWSIYVRRKLRLLQLQTFWWWMFCRPWGSVCGGRTASFCVPWRQNTWHVREEMESSRVGCIRVAGHSGMDTGLGGCKIRRVGKLHGVSRSIFAWGIILGKTFSCYKNLMWCSWGSVPSTLTLSIWWRSGVKFNGRQVTEDVDVVCIWL
jgi:hypothetical protein